MTMQETREIRVPSLGREDSLEQEMATHSSILAWRLLGTEEPDYKGATKTFAALPLSPLPGFETAF